MKLSSLLPPTLRGIDRRDNLENPSVDLVSALVADMDGSSVSSVTLTPAKALRLTAIYACVRLISESVGSLPLPVYRRDGKSRERVPQDPRWGLLNDQPNPEMHAMELHETTIGHANLWGHGYQYIRFNNAGVPAELWPLHPARTRPRRTTGGTLYYETQLDSGELVTLDATSVIDVKAIFGLSPVKTAREAIANAVAAEDYGGRFWANNARPGGVVEMKDGMDEDAYLEFKKRWNAGHQGLTRSHLVGILTNGAQWKEVGFAPEIAQFIQTKNFGIREISRLFRCPPHMIGDLEGTVTRASIETQAIEFVVYTLRPWLIRYEKACKMRLFNTNADKAAQLYPEFSVEGLLRGDTRARFDSYAKGIQFGFLNRAEPRELENLPFVEGLDTFLVPVNMQASDTLLDPKGDGGATAFANLALILHNDPAGAKLAALAAAIESQTAAEE